MFNRSLNKINTGNTNLSSDSSHRKCAHHIHSYSYAAHVKMHNDITQKAANRIASIDMDTTIVVKVIFHFLVPVGTYNRDKVIARAHDIIQSLNDDFNNYSKNPNTMNNFRYKNIVNQVFLHNMVKQTRYLSSEYLNLLPTKPSNIIFELGQVYFYPVRGRLNLAHYDDLVDVEMEQQAIKQFIYQNRAHATNPISPEYFLNIWVVDMNNTLILGFSSFPWEVIDGYHGIIVGLRVFFPEDYGEKNFNLFKTFTHEVGHFFGLLHVFNQNSAIGAYAAVNINTDDEKIVDDGGDYVADTPNQLTATYDPIDKIQNRKLHQDNNYNPLFMNFMDYTYDRYVTMFTKNQIQKMRYFIQTYRPKLNYNVHKIVPPAPKYDPETDKMIGNSSRLLESRMILPVPSIEPMIGSKVSKSVAEEVEDDVESQKLSEEKNNDTPNLFYRSFDPSGHLYYHQYYEQLERDEMEKMYHLHCAEDENLTFEDFSSDFHDHPCYCHSVSWNDEDNSDVETTQQMEESSLQSNDISIDHPPSKVFKNSNSVSQRSNITNQPKTSELIARAAKTDSMMNLEKMSRKDDELVTKMKPRCSSNYPNIPGKRACGTFQDGQGNRTRIPQHRFVRTKPANLR